jgi:GNAT superfamily N-acetyltransferase
MELRRVSYAEVAALVLALDAELMERYGGGDDVHIDPTDFDASHAVLLAGSVDGQDVAIGGVRWLSEGVAELKRMYVAPSVRGRGLSRVLLRSLLSFAGEAGYREVWLETGTKQPEAMALYESEGFTPIPPFGQYADEPDARCYRLVLEDLGP